MCDGYRGIALGTLPAKIYATVLNFRMAEWAEGGELRAEGQFGFRKGRGRSHAAFMLVHILVDQPYCGSTKLYYFVFLISKNVLLDARHLRNAMEQRCVTGWVRGARGTSRHFMLMFQCVSRPLTTV